MDKLLSRKNVYGVTLIILIVLIILSGFLPETREKINFFIFNPFWPIFLGIFEIYIQTMEKKVAKENEQKIIAVSAIIRGRLEKTDEHELMKSINDAITESDLLALNKRKIEEAEASRKIEEAGRVKGKSRGVNPN